MQLTKVLRSVFFLNPGQGLKNARHMQIGCILLAIFVVLSSRWYTPCAGEPAIQIARLLGVESAVAILADGGQWWLDKVGRYIQRVIALMSLACTQYSNPQAIKVSLNGPPFFSGSRLLISRRFVNPLQCKRQDRVPIHPLASP